MKLRIPILFLLSFILYSCSGSPDQVYDRNGISFSYPSDWKIQEDSDENGTVYLVVSNGKRDTKGVFSLTTWLDETGEQTMEQLASDNFDVLNDEVANAVVTAIAPTEFNGIPVLGFSYSGDFFDFPHRGSIYVFEKDTRKVQIIRLEAEQDIEKNEAGFARIESTFAFK